MKKTIAIMALVGLVGCGKQPLPVSVPGTSINGRASDLSKESWSLVGPKLAEQVRLALCPTQRTNAFTVEYIDSAPSVEVGLGRSGCRIVLAQEVFKHLTDPDPSPTRSAPSLRIREYIEVVVFPEHHGLPTNSCDLIPWSGFTSFYHLQPVNMGTGFGFHWFGRMHLWEQDDLRERLGLVGGDDRHALAVAAGSVKDDGRMTANSMAFRMDRFKQETGSNQASQAIGAPGAPQPER
jgi:hypothetical protein